MDISKMIAELNSQLLQLTDIRNSMMRYAQNQGRRRGRPPAFLSSSGLTANGKRRGRPPGVPNKPKGKHA